jgi:predicted GIY-YIG superfamily endonuclease
MAFTYILALTTRCMSATRRTSPRESKLTTMEKAPSTQRPEGLSAMVYARSIRPQEARSHAERQLKRWSHKKKEALILDDRAALKTLGRRFEEVEGSNSPGGIC